MNTLYKLNSQFAESNNTKCASLNPWSHDPMLSIEGNDFEKININLGTDRLAKKKKRMEFTQSCPGHSIVFTIDHGWGLLGSR